MSKKFINEVDCTVDDALRGLVNTDSNLCFHESCSRVILRSDYKERANNAAVSLIAGGGSGHEPYPSGFVGKGLLTAVVCGNVFASPPSSHVEAALNATKSKGGAILFVINYTGDRLNFGLAADRFKARGGKVRIVTISDDVAIEESNNRVGRRGLAAAVLAIKIAGAMSEKGLPMDEIADYIEKINENCGTLGVSLTPCSLPGKGAMFEIENEKMEVGLGIHGEPGKNRVNLEDAQATVQIVMKHIEESQKLQGKLPHDKPIIVLLNNLGGVTQLEMGILKQELMSWSEKSGYTIAQLICGPVMTSLDGHGFSITVLPVIDENVQKYLETPVNCLSWPSTLIPPKYKEFSFTEVAKDLTEESGAKLNENEAQIVRKCIENVCEALLSKRDKLDTLDGAAGDGDCGSTLAQAVRSIQAHFNSLHFAHPQSLLHQISKIFEEDVGGTTGGIYALLLEAGSHCFSNSAYAKDWIKALDQGIEAVMKYGGAKPGDRTMIDTLHAFISEFTSEQTGTEGEVKIDATVLRRAAEKSYKAAEDTAKMKASAGRASYTSENAQTQPDAGAMATAFWIQAISDGINEKVQTP